MRDCGKNARDPDAGREIKWRYAYGSRYQVIREFVGGAAFNSWCGFECRNLAVAKRARRADSALKSWGILDPDHVVLPLVEAQGIHLDVKHFAAKWRGARPIGGPRRARCARASHGLGGAFPQHLTSPPLLAGCPAGRAAGIAATLAARRALPACLASLRSADRSGPLRYATTSVHRIRYRTRCILPPNCTAPPGGARNPSCSTRRRCGSCPPRRKSGHSRSARSYAITILSPPSKAS